MKEIEDMLVLVVDDDDNAGEFIQCILKANGYRAALGRNGQDAVRMSKVLNPDLILLNVFMPMKNGWITFREIRRNPKTRHIKVVLFSADRDMKTRFHGADGYLQSPIRFEDLLETVGQLLADAPPIE